MRTLIPCIVALALSVAVNAENWPCWRGPSGQGVSTETGLPTEWSGSSNVAWKAAIPGEGWSSPIVWENRVFVTTTTEQGFSCRVLSLDRKTGKPVWDKEVFQQKPGRKEGRNSYATPTPICDGERVYAVFGDGSFVALDLNGSLLWTNRQVGFYSRHGLGASPILYNNLIILPVDWSNPVDKPGVYPKVSDTERLGWQLPWDKSYVLALDKKTGKEAWRTQRGLSRIAHVTPKVFVGGGVTELISAAGDVVQGFNPETGKLLWTVKSRGEGVVPSIVTGDDLVFTSSGFEGSTTRAVRPGGKGDVTQTHLAWEQKKGTPTLSSFIYCKPWLFGVTDGGIVTCWKAATGEILWQERIGGNHSTSPILADGRIYFLSDNGETTIVAAAPEFKVLARNSLGEKGQASMAASQKHLFIRTDKNLFCIGAPMGN